MQWSPYVYVSLWPRRSTGCRTTLFHLQVECEGNVSLYPTGGYKRGSTDFHPLCERIQDPIWFKLTNASYRKPWLGLQNRAKKRPRGGLIGQVRQLASTILHQPARVMIGNRDELKANQDDVVEPTVVSS